MKIIITGSTGYVGEGVLRTIIDRPEVEKVLSISRRPCGVGHPKLEELVLADLMDIKADDARLAGYDGVLFCAGMTGGFPKEKFRVICQDIPLHLAQMLPNREAMKYIFVSGSGAGKVKQETERWLFSMGFKEAYSYRMGIMKPLPSQKNNPKTIKMSQRWYSVSRALNFGNTMENIGLSMLECLKEGYKKPLIGIKDIDILAEKYKNE